MHKYLDYIVLITYKYILSSSYLYWFCSISNFFPENLKKTQFAHIVAFSSPFPSNRFVRKENVCFQQIFNKKILGETPYRLRMPTPPPTRPATSSSSHDAPPSPSFHQKHTIEERSL